MTDITARAAGSFDGPPEIDQLVVRYQKLHPDVQLPRKESAGAAGRDVRAYLLGTKVKFWTGQGVIERGPDTSVDPPFIRILPAERAIIPTGFRMALPPGYEMQVRPRSGASFKKGLHILNAPGTIDADYRGEVGIVVTNVSQVSLYIEHGERIAQIVLAKVPELPEIEVESLDDTERGEGGFGSTGT
jgi:dUTP pyrophosphatase